MRKHMQLKSKQTLLLFLQGEVFRCITPSDSNHVSCKNKIQTFYISKFIILKNKWRSNLLSLCLTKSVVNISAKHFLSHIYKNICTEISKQWLRRKYKALQGIVMKHFVYLYLSPLQKTMAIIVESPLPLFKG